MRCAWPKPMCDTEPNPRREGSLLQFCDEHQLAVDKLRDEILFRQHKEAKKRGA